MQMINDWKARNWKTKNYNGANPKIFLCLEKIHKLFQSNFLPFKLLVIIEKDGKNCLNSEKDEFDLQTACEAPVRG